MAEQTVEQAAEQKTGPTAEQKPEEFALEPRNRNLELPKEKLKYEPPAWLLDEHWDHKMIYDYLTDKGLLIKTPGKEPPLSTEKDKKFRQIGLQDTYGEDYSYWAGSKEEALIVNVAVNKIKLDPKIYLIRYFWSGDKAKATDNETPFQHAQEELDILEKEKGINVSPEFKIKFINLFENRRLEKKVYAMRKQKMSQEELSKLAEDSRGILLSLAKNQTFSDQELHNMIKETGEKVMKEININDFENIKKDDTRIINTVEGFMKKHGIGTIVLDI